MKQICREVRLQIQMKNDYKYMIILRITSHGASVKTLIATHGAHGTRKPFGSRWFSSQMQNR